MPDHHKYHRLARARGITPIITCCYAVHSFGKVRQLMEHTFGWIKSFRCLQVRNERRVDVHPAILSLDCSIICLRKLILN